MKSLSVEGVVIKRANYGEADKLITLFTRTSGKLTIVAKGVRKLTSKRAGSLELFNLVKAQIIPGKTNLGTLAEVKVLDTFKSWRRHLGRVNLAYQMCEAVDKLTADGEPSPVVFNILVTGLSQLGSLASDWQHYIDTWIVEIARDLGYWPKDKDFEGNTVDLVEEVSSRPYNSPRLLLKLKR